MKADIHPTYYPNARITCSCGNSWTTGATKPEIRTDVCYNCHPFYTGEQRIIDTEGQVDRFYKRLQARQEHVAAEKARSEQKEQAVLSLDNLGLSNRVKATLTAAGFTSVPQVLEKLNIEGDAGLLSIDGFGRQALADVKKALRTVGYEISTPEAAAAE